METAANTITQIKTVFRKIRNKDFSGSTGIALKNSILQFSTTFVGKIGALILTILLARILMPELFGLYTLALSTILIFVAFSDLGIGDTLVRFVSRELGRKKETKAMSYSSYLIKIKVAIMLVVSGILIIFSKLIANSYYHKPIHYALIAGSLYLFFGGMVVILQALLQAHNLFKPIFFRETLFQIIRVTVVPLLVLFAINNSFSKEIIVLLIIVILSLSFAVSVGLLYAFTRKMLFKKSYPDVPLSKSERKEVNKFMFLNSTIVLSGVFFGYIDIVMLGYFVSSEFIGYYQGAFSFIGAIISLITFSAALLPVFSRMNKNRVNILMKKTIKVMSLVSIAAFIVTFFGANILVTVILGHDYQNSVAILRILSLLLLSIPITTIYSTYFVSTGKPEIVSKLLLYSTILNIILNYAFIKTFISHGSLYAVYGASIAAVISRFVYTGMLAVYKKKYSK